MMKEKINNRLIWLAIIGIVIFWTWLLEWMSPGTPFQAFFFALLFCTPFTIAFIIVAAAAICKINNSIDLATDPGFAEESQLKEKLNEGERILKNLDRELLFPYTSLSWKYKLISDFCFDYPEYLPQLKENENYIRWRTDVIDWAKNNIDRLEGFYLYDGICDYIFDASLQTEGIVDVKAKCNIPQDMDCDVICDVEFKNKRVPEDYFEFPGLVWESEDIDVDDYIVKKKHPTAAEALSFGIGLAAGGALFGGNDCGCGGNDAGDCGGLS